MEKSTEQILEELNKVSAKNASQSMRMARALFITKDNKFYSLVANEYENKLKGYSAYCKPDSQELWNTHINNIMMLAGIVSDAEFCYIAGDYEGAGKMLELLSTNQEWGKVEQLISDQGHTNSSFSTLGQLLLMFSDRGIEFIEKEGMDDLRGAPNLKKAYEETKKTQTKELHQRLVKVLTLRKNSLTK